MCADIALIAGAWLTLKFLTIDISAGMVGVRTQEYGILGKKGALKQDYGPGYHRDLGPIDSWVLFDGTVQALEVTRESERGSKAGKDDVQVQSSDGYRVSVDVTVKYQIENGKAHKLYQDTGSGTKYAATVRNEAQQACMELFGQMATEDFYESEICRDNAGKVTAMLQSSVADNFVTVLDVLIRDVEFDPEYEEKIRRKKLADQEVEVNKSMAKAAEMAGVMQVVEAETVRMVEVIKKEMEAELVRMEAETQREIAKIKADADKYATEKQSDADLVEAQKGAEGELLIREVEAEGERLRNMALSGGGAIRSWLWKPRAMSAWGG